MKDTTITFRLSEFEKAKIVAEAKKRDVSVAQIIREACRKYLESEEQ